MMVWIWTAAAFMSGSLMFSYWLGLARRTDLRAHGDGNPGARNLWAASGYQFGLAGIVLDFGKGYVPVLLLLQLADVRGLAVIPVALAPIAGHAFSPFLRGRGGKAIAVTFGVWSALTAFEVSLAYAVILAVLLLSVRYLRKDRASTSEADAWQVAGGQLLVGFYMLLRGFPGELFGVWVGIVLLLAFTHRTELMAWRRRSRLPEAERRPDM